MSTFCERLGLTVPLIGAPMAGGPSTPALAAAISNAGGLGSLGAAYLSAPAIEKTIAETRQLTSKPFAVNLFISSPIPRPSEDRVTAAAVALRSFANDLGIPEPTLTEPYAEDFNAQMEAVLRAKPAVVSFVFGILDPHWLKECRARSILTLAGATTLQEAEALAATGVDAIVAQGVEAGGHRSILSPTAEDHGLGTLSLTRLLVSRLKCPVIAAGGIMDGAGIASVLSLGAVAAQLGTAFLLCDEAGTSPAYRAALSGAGTKRTRLTRAFSGRFARGLENRFMMEVAAENCLPFPAQNKLTRSIRNRASELGRAEFLSLWAGQGVDLIRKMKAGDLVQTLKAEFQRAREVSGPAF